LNYRAALAWLYGTQRFGIKLGLENIRRLLAALDLPSPAHRIIHVAGTNGKGSVCAMIDAICRAQGYRTALFTSPHLVTFRERIRVNGEMIGEQEVAEGLSAIRDLIANWEPSPTFFEITTALALRHFSERNADIVVLETGMGGRLDATNAVQPVVSVITPIDLDHQQWLGDSIEKIAGEKAGIIKPGVPVVSALQKTETETVVQTRAAECKSPFKFISGTYETESLALKGRHQKQNGALAIAAVHSGGIEVSANAIRQGLTSVSWPARFQQWDDRTIIDGAHNPAGARVLAETWREVFSEEKAALIFGVLRDKNAAKIYRELADLVDSVFLPTFRGERAMPPKELAQLIASITPGKQVFIANSCAEALTAAQNKTHRVLVAGSLHLAGEMLALLRGESSAFEECAQ
jgi:dihydrofolate synthase/folylpolyglutamate synthase